MFVKIVFRYPQWINLFKFSVLDTGCQILDSGSVNRCALSIDKSYEILSQSERNYDNRYKQFYGTFWRTKLKITKNGVAREKYRLLLIPLAVVVLLLAGCSGGNPDAEKAAVSAALDWLELLDTGMYDDSWEVTAEHFKKTGSKEEWKMMLDAVRKPRGKLISRKVQTTKYKTRMPDAPIGEFVIVTFDVKFDTDYENEPVAVESVVTVWDKENRWRVIGYTLE